ncbi:AcrR family transcriptional regulator [Rhodoligotrophos appendicifer]|uniref:TetR/AcrR family transcriptional regulator n=1 Tax=Rhodoligotrophos appendicifer TaxID=987056 RepID=UPI0011855B2E|nr:TetR/AcrR family transcriptional regulator [Rhodoligotrophos appendicifer]
MNSDAQSGDPEGLRPRRKRRSREQRARENRNALIKAAAEIVGESGFEGATITEITRRAGISLGAFYQHFDSREHLFDQLLPDVGALLISALSQETHEAKDAIEGEERAIKAYFRYLNSGSPIMRLFKESEVYAAKTYDAYMNDVLRRYTRTLRRRKAEGAFTSFDDRELEAVALMLTVARVEFFQRYASRGQDTAWIEAAFVKIVRLLSP